MCRTYADLDADVEGGVLEEEKDESDDEGDDIDGELDARHATASGAAYTKQLEHEPPTSQPRIADTAAYPTPVRPQRASRNETEAERSDREERRLLLERLEREALETALEVSKAQYEADMTMRSQDDPRWESGTNNPFMDGHVSQQLPQIQGSIPLTVHTDTLPSPPIAMPGAFATQQLSYPNPANLDPSNPYASPMTRVNSPLLHPVDGPGAARLSELMTPTNPYAYPFYQPPGAMPAVRSPSSTIASRSPLSTSPPDVSNVRSGLGGVTEGENEGLQRSPSGWGSRTPETHNNMILPVDPSGILHPSI
jgi:hypothetical protein